MSFNKNDYNNFFIMKYVLKLFFLYDLTGLDRSAIEPPIPYYSECISSTLTLQSLSGSPKNNTKRVIPHPVLS